MNEQPSRKRMRLQGYDYSQDGAYFVTVCVQNRRHTLGEIVGAAHPGGPQTLLSEIGQFVKGSIEMIPDVYEYIHLNKYVIMPNHIHMILCIEGGPPGCAAPTKSTLAKAMGALKSLTSRRYASQLWQDGYYDHIIRNEADYLNICTYIDQNPAEWAQDCYFSDSEAYSH